MIFYNPNALPLFLRIFDCFGCFKNFHRLNMLTIRTSDLKFLTFSHLNLPFPLLNHCNITKTAFTSKILYINSIKKAKKMQKKIASSQTILKLKNIFQQGLQFKQKIIVPTDLSLKLYPQSFRNHLIPLKNHFCPISAHITLISQGKIYNPFTLLLSVACSLASTAVIGSVNWYYIFGNSLLLVESQIGRAHV